MPDYITEEDRERARLHIAAIRALHHLGKRVEVVVEKPTHDVANCDFCLGRDCFWCTRAGLTMAVCAHTVSGRHGTAEVAPEPVSEPEPVVEQPDVPSFDPDRDYADEE